MSADTLKISANPTPVFGQEAELQIPEKQLVTYYIVKIKAKYSVQFEDFQLDNTFISFLTADDAVQKITNETIKPSAVFVDADADKEQLQNLHDTLAAHCIPYILFTGKFDPEAKCKAEQLHVDDYLFGAINYSLLKRIDIIRKLKIYKANRESILKSQRPKTIPKVKLWRLKRTVDIAAALSAIIILSPVLLLIALIIKLESKGPVFYISKRAGAGYKIFDFYKFRSMRAGADQELKKFAALNQYGTDESDTVFFKIKDDPRITKFGMFLRKTSLDEIPQLLNVLKGDMSLVGNRPLPLYEAEKLTKDQIAWRFLAPAGLTGLWQITKRGKDDMSPEERIQLDMEYAMNNSFLGDMKIIFKTFPALLQKEKV
ncbi:MAG: sugar transferase [Cyclobacteriaceae bacterium]|nr:sugar transferase [Cyclobacteriaceae bacterium]UYN85806.1 MAG: sugar transferase [Cyclobacteriaceae bacterium]